MIGACPYRPEGEGAKAPSPSGLFFFRCAISYILLLDISLEHHARLVQRGIYSGLMGKKYMKLEIVGSGVNGRICYADLVSAANQLDVELLDHPPEEGEFYLADRNTFVFLLTCRFVDPGGWIVPKEIAYSYASWECCAVRERNSK